MEGKLKWPSSTWLSIVNYSCILVSIRFCTLINMKFGEHLLAPNQIGKSKSKEKKQQVVNMFFKTSFLRHEAKQV